MNKKGKVALLLMFVLVSISREVNAQSKFSLMPGLFFNGQFLRDEVNGFGVIGGLEYMTRPDHFFSVELRTKFGSYFFDDGTKWTTKEDGTYEPPKNPGKARLEYNLFSPQVGVVPKFHWHWDESLSLFLENELAVGLVAGRFQYKNVEGKKRFTDAIFAYNVGVGMEYKKKKFSWVASITYSTLNFRENVRKHRPAGYEEWIPNQDACIAINIIFKIPLAKASR